MNLAKLLLGFLKSDIEKLDFARARHAQIVAEIQEADFTVEEVRAEMLRQGELSAAPVAEPANETLAEKNSRLDADLVAAEVAYSLGVKDGIIFGIPDALLSRQVKQPPPGALAVPPSNKANHRAEALVIGLSAKREVVMDTGSNGKAVTNIAWIGSGAAQSGRDGVVRRAAACSALRQRALRRLHEALETAQCMVAWFGAAYTRRGKVLQGERKAKHMKAQAVQQARALVLWKRYELWEVGGFLGLDNIIVQRGDYNCSFEEFLSGTPGPWARSRRFAAPNVAPVGYISSLGTNVAQEAAGMQFFGEQLYARGEEAKRAEEGIEHIKVEMKSVELHHDARIAAVTTAIRSLSAHAEALRAAACEDGRCADGVPWSPAMSPRPEDEFADRTIFQLRVDFELTHGKLSRLRKIEANDRAICADVKRRFVDARALLALAPQVRVQQAERRQAEAILRKSRAGGLRPAAGDGNEDGAGDGDASEGEDGIGATTGMVAGLEAVGHDNRLGCLERWVQCTRCKKWRRAPAEIVGVEEPRWVCGDFHDPGWDNCSDAAEFATEAELEDYLGLAAAAQGRDEEG